MCQAGCVLESLDTFLADKGLMMPLDLGAKGRYEYLYKLNFIKDIYMYIYMTVPRRYIHVYCISVSFYIQFIMYFIYFLNIRYILYVYIFNDNLSNKV